MRIIFIILSLITILVSHEAEARADKVKSIIATVGQRFAPDRRQAVYDISVSKDSTGKISITGKTSEAEALGSLKYELAKIGLNDLADRIVLLGGDEWALPTISVANIRSKPSHSAELASQVLMGMPLQILESEGDWLRVRCPDGYIGWMSLGSAVKKTSAEMRRWRSASRGVITSVYQTRCYTSDKTSGPRDVVSDLVNGDIIELTGKSGNGCLQVVLPDGRKAWIDSSAITEISEWASQDFDGTKIVDMAYSMTGQPYLWGGTSTKSLDCSGLVKVCYLANGIILRRDASQQAATGCRIEAKNWRDCAAGDLLFFGNGRSGKVTHVAIYDSNGRYVHSSGRVKCNSVDPTSDRYLATPFLHCVRVNGYEGSDGIMRAKDHPWYFNL